jgi:hypothetical protein
MLEHGKWPQPQALHKCDNPTCVRVSHLFEGTNSDNHLDKIRKGRQARGEVQGTWSRGETNTQAKLTNKKVQTTRRLYVKGVANQHELSAMFEVSQSLVNRIIHRKNWKHV